ncbi:MAG TPA: GNAT family N-acetyltransferase [Acidimicrobiia bacterium]|nr:GNAT family N-acetyltransferase [Acidimicrobiia bacterium]
MQVAVEPIVDLPTGRLQEWRTLATAAVEPNPCSEPAIAASAAPTLLGGASAALLSVRVGDRLVLALPVVAIRQYRRVPVPGFATWRHAHFTSGVPLVAPGSGPAAWAAVLDWMAEERVPWLVLETVHDGGPAVEPLEEVLGRRGRRAHRFETYERAVVHRRAEPSYTDGRMSGSRRKKLRRRRRQLSELLGEEVRTTELLAMGSGLDASVDEFLRLEASGWKGEEQTALASRAGDAAFFRRSCSSLHAEGRLQIWRLGTATRTVSMACAALAGDTVFHLKVAYDEQFAHFSPGIQLELDLLAAFHADARLVSLDSCTGADNEAMNQLYPDRMAMATLLVAPSDLRGRAAAALTPPAVRAFRRSRRLAYRAVGRTPPSDHGVVA